MDLEAGRGHAMTKQRAAKRRNRNRQVWFVAHCKLRQEGRANEHLLDQGFGVYLPLVWVDRRGAEIAQPLFPGYLFVRFNPSRKSASLVRCTRGVIGLVKFGDIAAVVPDELVESIKSLEQDGVHPNPRREFRKGDKVRLGPGLGVFSGLLAEVASGGGNRVIVLFEALGRFNRLNVARSDLVLL
jgi:transcriptional antiterminator RfaH